VQKKIRLRILLTINHRRTDKGYSKSIPTELAGCSVQTKAMASAYCQFICPPALILANAHIHNR